ncbi:MAG: hypothetical protein AMXMBFR23_22240 [Chloroflexota bacterium]
MESIRELRVKCQGVHAGDWTVQPVRWVSIYLTRILIPLGLTANQASILNLLVGLAAAACFAVGVTAWPLGCALLALNMILDCVDGELARYRGSSSLTGLYLDRLNSLTMYPSVLLGLGWVTAERYDSPAILIAAAIGAWGFVALRLAKANVDVSAIDALRRPGDVPRGQGKAPVADAPDLGNALRQGGALPAVVLDFILVRQLGFVLVVVAATALEMVVGPARIWLSPVAGVLAGYAGAVLLAFPAAVLLIVRRSAVDETYEVIQAAAARQRPRP